MFPGIDERPAGHSRTDPPPPLPQPLIALLKNKQRDVRQATGGLAGPSATITATSLWRNRAMQLEQVPLPLGVSGEGYILRESAYTPHISRAAQIRYAEWQLAGERMRDSIDRMTQFKGTHARVPVARLHLIDAESGAVTRKSRLVHTRNPRNIRRAYERLLQAIPILTSSPHPETKEDRWILVNTTPSSAPIPVMTPQQARWIQ